MLAVPMQSICPAALSESICARQYCACGGLSLSLLER